MTRSLYLHDTADLDEIEVQIIEARFNGGGVEWRTPSMTDWNLEPLRSVDELLAELWRSGSVSPRLSIYIEWWRE